MACSAIFTYSYFRYEGKKFRDNKTIEPNQHNIPCKGSYKTDRPPTLSIEDGNPMLINFCKTLESAFRHGAIHEDKRNKFELIDLLLHIARKQHAGQLFCVGLCCVLFSKFKNTIHFYIILG